jgi:hypothetical protein
MMDKMAEEQTILQEDQDLILITDSIPEAVEYIRSGTFSKFEISKKKAPSAISVFFERRLKK